MATSSVWVNLREREQATTRPRVGMLRISLGALTMAVRIVRLGSKRAAREGLRIGTVRRPPRGVPAREFVSGNWYDVWFPALSPSAGLVKLALAARTPAQWATFVKRFKREMASSPASRTLGLLAALSRTADFSVGCYCEDESRCHRAVLRELLQARGADLV
jgi:uncharacterized protein YeaO (DUF488 family)